jgi:hypothetical protein
MWFFPIVPIRDRIADVYMGIVFLHPSKIYMFSREITLKNGKTVRTYMILGMLRRPSNGRS